MLKNGCLAPQTLIVKKDAEVMFIKNNFEKGYVYGTLGSVVCFDEEGYPVVSTFNGQEISASPETWNVEENGKILAKITQVPLRLAWAITIHKSQGMTLDAAEINLADAFEKGMGYVALSRVRSLDGIRLTGLNEIALQVRPEILAYDKELQQRSEGARQELYSTLEGDKKLKFQKTKKTYWVDEIRKSHLMAYQKWSFAEEKTLVSDFKKGMKISMIAKNLKRKDGAIRSRLKKLGFVRH
ncbi:MAG: hypothetical protein NTW60_03825 [Candidatus Wolfebacteria bacterium]|nr:hypothetical protein [Candidatus Wolfebacteria bacterium]